MPNSSFTQLVDEKIDRKVWVVWSNMEDGLSIFHNFPLNPLWDWCLKAQGILIYFTITRTNVIDPAK